MAESLFGYGHMSMQIKNSGENEICFKNDFTLRDTKIQKHNCMLIWTIIVYGFTRTCAKPSGLGCSPDCL